MSKRNSWTSFPKVYALGHKAIGDLLDEPVYVEEKIDGSQFSFGVIDGCLRTKSKNCEPPDKMFDAAVSTAKNLKPYLIPGWTYRAEFLKSPHHNVLSYDRVPKSNIIIFDIARGYEDYLEPEEKRDEAERLGLEVVPLLASGEMDYESMEELLDRESILGGCKVEGVTIKDYSRFDKRKKPLMGKLVRDDFREKNKGGGNSGKSIIGKIIDRLHNESRWEKAIQHRRERGELEVAPQDIGPLMHEIQDDIKEEEEEWIKEQLFAHYWDDIRRGATGGFPEWYKQQLAKGEV